MQHLQTVEIEEGVGSQSGDVVVVEVEVTEGTCPDEQFPAKSTESVVIERQHFELRVLDERHIFDDTDFVVTQVKHSEFFERRKVLSCDPRQAVVRHAEVVQRREVAEDAGSDVTQLVGGEPQHT